MSKQCKAEGLSSRGFSALTLMPGVIVHLLSGWGDEGEMEASETQKEDIQLLFLGAVDG